MVWKSRGKMKYLAKMEKATVEICKISQRVCILKSMRWSGKWAKNCIKSGKTFSGQKWEPCQLSFALGSSVLETRKIPRTTENVHWTLIEFSFFAPAEQKRSKSPFNWRSRSMERQDPYKMPPAGKITQDVCFCFGLSDTRSSFVLLKEFRSGVG